MYLSTTNAQLRAITAGGRTPKTVFGTGRPLRSKPVAVVAAALVLAAWGTAPGVANADPAPPPAPKTTIDNDGTYVVGTDIEPGTYTSAGGAAGGTCYWKRMSSLNGSDIIDNALSSKPQVVQIDPSDKAFKTDHCQPWQKTDDPAVVPPPAGQPSDLLQALQRLLSQR